MIYCMLSSAKRCCCKDAREWIRRDRWPTPAEVALLRPEECANRKEWCRFEKQERDYVLTPIATLGGYEVAGVALVDFGCFRTTR